MQPNKFLMLIKRDFFKEECLENPTLFVKLKIRQHLRLLIDAWCYGGLWCDFKLKLLLMYKATNP